MNVAHCGTLHGYTRDGCRCEACREVNAAYHRQRRKRYWSPRQLVHGRRSTYINYLCKCEPCREANSAYLEKKLDRTRAA